MVTTTSRRGITAASLAAFMLTALVLGGCSGGRRGPVTEFVPYTVAEQQMREEAREARYRLRIGDEVNIDLKYTNKLDFMGVQVLPDGRLAVTGMDEVRAEGLTLAELDSVLTSYYARDYRDPQLSIILNKMGSSSVYVLGEVRSPGVFTIPTTGAGVLQSVVMAGGFTEYAKPSETVLIRVTADGYQYIHVDLADLGTHRDMAPASLRLQAYDVVFVPKTKIGDFAYFTKNVLGGVLNITDLFWDIYAIANIDKVDRLVR